MGAGGEAQACGPRAGDVRLDPEARSRRASRPAMSLLQGPVTGAVSGVEDGALWLAGPGRLSEG